jgi:hypothetical protein
MTTIWDPQLEVWPETWSSSLRPKKDDDDDWRRASDSFVGECLPGGPR